MATGVTTTSSIDNDSATFIMKMLEVREHTPVMPQLTDEKTLPNGHGLTVNEPYTNSLIATAHTDGVEYDSPQLLSDTNVQYTVSQYLVQTLITYHSNDQVREDLFGYAGRLMGRAIAYKRDTTGLTMLDGFGASLGSGTAQMVIGHIANGAAAIRAGIALSGGTARTGARATGDPADSDISCVMHEFQMRSLNAQMNGFASGASDGKVATTALFDGFGSNRVGISNWQQQFVENHQVKRIEGVRCLTDNNLTIASSAAKAGVFERNALVHIKFRMPHHYRVKTRDGLAEVLTSGDTWGWGERIDTGGVELNCAAVLATS